MSVITYREFIFSENATVVNAVQIFGKDREIGGGTYYCGKPGKMYFGINKVGFVDRPFTYGLVYDTFQLMLEGGLAKRMGNLIPLLRLTIYDVLADGTRKLAANGLLGRLAIEFDEPIQSEISKI